MTISTDPWTWIAVFMTLAIFSFLYRDNPLYRVAEHIFVGASIGYYIPYIWFRNFMPYLYEPLVENHDWLIIPPMLLGVLFASFFFPRYAWLGRFPIAFTMGLASGISIPLGIGATIMTQARGTFYETNPITGAATIPLFNLAKFNTFFQQPSLQTGLDALYGPLLILGVLTVMIYFYFSHEQKGVIKVAGSVGVAYMMIAFGASFGYTVMARLSLLIGRLNFLLGDWLGVL